MNEQRRNESRQKGGSSVNTRSSLETRSSKRRRIEAAKRKYVD